MEYIYAGKIVNTHGIKGEGRILSTFSDKSIFNKDKVIYVGKNYEPLTITSYRVHKNYDMVTFEGINDINEVLKYKGNNVYVLNNINTVETLIGYEVYTDHLIGTVSDILYGVKYSILKVGSNMIPYIDEFIINVDNDNKKLYIKEIEGLINEN